MMRSAFRVWVRRAFIGFAVALTLSPLGFVVARVYDDKWYGLNDLFENLILCWFLEMVAAFVGAVLIGQIKDERARQGDRGSRAELFISRLAYWPALVLSLALPCAVAWVFMMGVGMSS